MKEIVVTSNGTGLGTDQEILDRGHDVGYRCGFPLQSWTFSTICI